METLGIPSLDGSPVEKDPRKIWQTFAENYHLFRGTPTGMWLAQEFYELFGIRQGLNGENGQTIYDGISSHLSSPEFRPRALYKRFGIEVLCTTDAAWDTLDNHKTIRDSGWEGAILPTFRPDGVLDLRSPAWAGNLEKLKAASGMEIDSYRSFIQALEKQREFFRAMGAKATDHAVLTPTTNLLSENEIEDIFQQALEGNASPAEAARFEGHMLIEMARMSVEDGLVMMLHPGAFRGHNEQFTRRFGKDTGNDIPVAHEFTQGLKPLLDRFGNDPRLTLILFTLDETNYSRELAPLAGHYPSVKLGPPWWFHDSLNGMRRFFDEVMETAGIYNTAGFNDDTRAFPSIPARHDLWRRAAADWVAGLEVRHIVNRREAEEMIWEMAYGLAKKAYKL
jgi:glucuronate isomerase